MLTSEPFALVPWNTLQSSSPAVVAGAGPGGRSRAPSHCQRSTKRCIEDPATTRPYQSSASTQDVIHRNKWIFVYQMKKNNKMLCCCTCAHVTCTLQADKFWVVHLLMCMAMKGTYYVWEWVRCGIGGCVDEICMCCLEKIERSGRWKGRNQEESEERRR